MKEDVGGDKELLKGVQATRIVVVEDHRALVAVGGKKISRFAGDERRTPSSRLIAGAGTLDLDYIGAEIAKQHGTIGAGERFGEFDNADAIENGIHGR